MCESPVHKEIRNIVVSLTCFCFQTVSERGTVRGMRACVCMGGKGEGRERDCDKEWTLSNSQQMPKSVDADCSYCTLIGHTLGEKYIYKRRRGKKEERGGKRLGDREIKGEREWEMKSTAVIKQSNDLSSRKTHSNTDKRMQT